MIRSIAAVVVGYVMSAFIVVLGTTAAAALLLPRPQAGAVPQITTAYLVADLLIAVVAAIAGGMVAAAIGQRAPILHAAALAVLMFVVGIGSSVAAGGALPGQPAWYPLAIAVIGPLGVLVGGWLQSNRTRLAPAS